MGRPTKLTVCFDACVFIAYLKGEPGQFDLARDAILDAESGSITAITSTLAIAEAFSPGAADPAKIDELQRMFRRTWLYVVSLDPPIAELAAEIARKYHPRARDSIYAATAVSKGANYVFTFDEPFIRNMSENTLGITVCKPFSEQIRVV